MDVKELDKFFVNNYNENWTDEQKEAYEYVEDIVNKHIYKSDFCYAIGLSPYELVKFTWEVDDEKLVNEDTIYYNIVDIEVCSGMSIISNIYCRDIDIWPVDEYKEAKEELEKARNSNCHLAFDNVFASLANKDSDNPKTVKDLKLFRIQMLDPEEVSE